MYLMTYTTASLGGYDRYFDAKLDERDRIGVLDTNDMVEEDVHLSDFENILKVNPDIKVVGIKHNGKTIEKLYGFPNNNSFEIGKNICVHYKQSMNRGSYCDVAVYLKGLDGCALKISTPHADGRYDWRFRIKSETEHKLVLSVELQSKNRDYELNDIIILFDLNKKVCKLEQFPSEEEVRWY